MGESMIELDKLPPGVTELGKLQGNAGPPNVLRAGMTYTVAAGSPARAEVRGTSPSQFVDLWLPRGLPAKPDEVVESEEWLAEYLSTRDSLPGQALDRLYGLEALLNPETELHAAWQDFIRVNMGGGAESRVTVQRDTLTNIRAPRPDWPGIVEWWVPVGSITPPNYLAGDIVVEVALEPAPWRPADHPFLLAHWDPANAGVSDGEKVETLPDGSASGWTLVQTLDAAQPVYRAAGINGQPALQFTGTEFLKTLAIAGGNRTPSTTYLVLKGADAVNSGGSRFAMDLLTGSTAIGGAFGRSATNKWTYTAGPTNATTVDSDNQATIATLRFAADGSGEILINNTSRATIAATTSRPTFNGVSIGARGDGLNGWRGMIAEPIMVSATTAGTTHTQMMTYLSTKYGVVLP